MSGDPTRPALGDVRYLGTRIEWWTGSDWCPAGSDDGALRIQDGRLQKRQWGMWQNVDLASEVPDLGRKSDLLSMQFDARSGELRGELATLRGDVAQLRAIDERLSREGSFATAESVAALGLKLDEFRAMIPLPSAYANSFQVMDDIQNGRSGWDACMREELRLALIKDQSKEETMADVGQAEQRDPNKGREEVQIGVFLESDDELRSRLVVAYEIREGKTANPQSTLYRCGPVELNAWADHLEVRRRVFNALGHHAGEWHPVTPAMNGWIKEKTVDTKEPSMTEKYPVLKTLQTDAVDAAYRTAGSQFVKLTREPLVALLMRHLGDGDPSLRAKLAAFLETELGTAMLASLLSLGLSAVPQTSSEVPQRLARELRVRAMGDVGDVVADVVMGPLRQVMAFYLQDVGGIGVAAAEPRALAEHTPSGLGAELREQGAVRT